MITKTCKRCGKVKPLSELRSHKTSTYGKAALCHECNRRGYAEWSRNCPEKVKAKNQRRRALKGGLPNELKSGEWESVLEQYGWRCALTGTAENVTMEHFIPLSWGHGGTFVGNVYPMNKDLNFDKYNFNPFEWIKDPSRAHLVENFNKVVANLAELNGLTVEEFRRFVYWCDANRRTAEQAEWATKLGINSIDLWRLAESKQREEVA